MRRCLLGIAALLVTVHIAEAAPTTTPAAARPIHLRINFQPAGAPTPAGYRPDYGAPFGERGEGLAYGWDADNAAAAARRGAFDGSHPPHDTFVALQPGGADRHWEVALADGWYVVRILAGDARSLDAVYHIDAEGTPVINAAPADAARWREGVAVVPVTDGRLTISNGAAARNNKICSIEVRSAHDPGRIISWHNIGSSSPQRADRQVGWDLKKTGWRRYVLRHVEPQVRWGVRRFVIHNPFGTLPNENMQFDQYVHAKDARLTWLTTDFVEAWKPVTARGVEVICYLGAMAGDADFDDPAKADPVAGWQPRFWESVQPALDAGMSVAFDASAIQPAGSPTHRAVELLRQRGVKVYIEARPRRDLTHWHDFPVICVDSFWHQSDPARSPGAVPWAARNEQLTGEIVRIITAPPEGRRWEQRGWVGPYARDILRDGHTAAAPVGMLIGERLTLADLLTIPQPDPGATP